MLNWKEKLFYKDNFFLFQDFKEYIRTLRIPAYDQLPRARRFCVDAD